jgi:uncharacterized protein (TIGR02246 family)
MSDEMVARDLLALENEYWQAVKDGDVDVAMRLTGDPCLVAGAQGVALLDRETFSRMMRAAQYQLHHFELKNPQVRVLGDDVAVLAYEVDERLTVDGKPVTLTAADASTWIRRDGRWVCALHTESVKGDPFGRDRKGSTNGAGS